MTLSAGNIMPLDDRSFHSSANSVQPPSSGSVPRVVMRLMVLIACLMPPWATLAQAAPARDASPLTIKQIHSGHSLTDTAAFKGTWPGHLQAMINDIQSGAAQLGKSTIPGSPMSWRWNNTPGYGDPDAKADIASWEVLVITEAVPLNSYLESPQWLRTWTEHAWENGNGGNGAPTLLYTTWTNINHQDGDFRSTLEDYEPQWEAMADYAAANLPEPATVYIVPGHRLMMGLYDDIEAGNVPGVNDISAFFEDTIHPNGLGSYAIALLHLAVLHHVDPRGLPHSGYGLSPEPSAALAAYLQEKVWEVATGYERTGLVASDNTQSSVTASDFVRIVETTGVGTSLELNNGGTTTPDKDWSIFNDSANQRLSFDFFSSENVLESTPFILENGAPTASLRVTSDGLVGLDTNTPGGPLNSGLTVSDNSRPSIFFDQASGPANWSIGASGSSGAFIANNTTTLLSILPSGNVGLSSGVPPEAKLHVGGTNDAKILARNDGNGIGTKIMFNLENDGGIRFDMLDRSTGDNWVFQNQIGTFDVTLAGTGTREFRFYPNGNLEILGAYLQSSSRSVKHGIEPVDLPSVLAKLVALPINYWSYNRERGVRHMGPMSEDFYASFGLGGTNKGITTVDAGGVALAAIQGLKQEKDADIDLLKGRLQQQDERMQQLEMALLALGKNESDTMRLNTRYALKKTKQPHSYH